MATNITTSTTNKQIDYIAKDFSSVVDSLISYATTNFGPGTVSNRLWTNFNVDSFSRTWLELVAFTSDQLFFYLDNQATQTYLQTATVRSAIKDIAKQFGFVPATATSASGQVTFTFTAAGVIPRGFRLQSSNGDEFFVTESVIAGAAGDVNGNVLQGVINDEQFTAEGLQNEEFNLAGPNVIRDLDNLNSADISPQVTVAGNDYTLVDSFIRHNGTDTPAVEDSLGNVIGGGGRVFTLNERNDGTPFIKFGDGTFGRKLDPAEVINVTYRSGGGSAGNISADSLTVFVDSNPVVSAVTNDSDFSGGSDEQSIEQLRELIPASLRTLERAVAEKDYSDILVANFNEVFDASTERNVTDPGIDLNVYVVPVGNGIPSITANTVLFDQLTNFLNRRKMVTIQYQILDAFGIDVIIDLEIFITESSSKSTVRSSIEAAIQDFFDLETGGSNGEGIGFAQNILLKDLCDIVENINGVVRFEIKKLTYKPRIDKDVIGLNTDYNTSEVTIFNDVDELEWLPAAAGIKNETPGGILFDNTGLVAFTYSSSTGIIQYATAVDLSEVSPGDTFRDGAAATFTILGVDNANNNITLDSGLTMDNTVNSSDDGRITNGSTAFESYKVFKKTLGIASNLSISSITDKDLDFSVLNSTAVSLSSTILLDNTKTFVPDEFATGEFYLIDSVNNVWDIISNDSNTITTDISAVNDAAITTVEEGAYSIVTKLNGRTIVFNDSVFSIQFNNKNSIFSIGAQFNQIGTIGDQFELSEEQVNIGKFGIGLDLLAFDSGTGKITLNRVPDLTGISLEDFLIDSSGQIFKLKAIDNVNKPVVLYSSANQSDSFILEGSGLGIQLAQGFKVTSTDTYAAVSMNLQREGNITGNLSMKIVDDDGGGLPDLGSVVATSSIIDVTTIDESFEKVIFTFVTPPTLTSGTQYHLVVAGDAIYNSNEDSGTVLFDNTGLVGFTYNSVSGAIDYSSTVDLSSVEPGNYFQDGAGVLFKILAVDDSNDQLTIATGQTVDNTVNSSDDGSVIRNDRILVGVDDVSPTYLDGEFSRYDGAAWSNSTLGPSPLPANTDGIFSVEGTKSVSVDSNLTPILGSGATIATRYYDDDNTVSFIIGITQGSTTSATDVLPNGKGTVGGIPDSRVDSFIFRTSRIADDIVNLRLNEIPEISVSDIATTILGGVE